ncbi:MAG: hypothetical protein ACLQRH_06470 [Acidimicrobiales bacterium]
MALASSLSVPNGFTTHSVTLAAPGGQETQVAFTGKSGASGRPSQPRYPFVVGGAVPAWQEGEAATWNGPDQHISGERPTGIEPA